MHYAFFTASFGHRDSPALRLLLSFRSSSACVGGLTELPEYGFCKQNSDMRGCVLT